MYYKCNSSKSVTVGEKELSLHTRQVTHQAEVHSDFRRMRPLGVFLDLSTPLWMGC